MKNILLLGGTGFIGKNIIEFYLFNSEVNLIVFTRDILNIDQKYLISNNIKIEIGAINDIDFIKKIIRDQKINVVIHLVSSIIASSSIEEFYDGLDSVVIPTIKLIDFISDKNIKFIFFSSGGTIYGNSHDIISETTDLKPINNYGYSKLVIENYIQLKSNTADLDYIIVRPSNVYGKYQSFDGSQGFISVAINRIHNGIPIEIWGDGKVIRDYVNVIDVVSVLDKLLFNSISNVTINLSTGLGFSLLEVIAIVENNLKIAAKINFNSKRSVDASKVILDNSKLLKIISHNFINTDVGIAKQINYFKTCLYNEK